MTQTDMDEWTDLGPGKCCDFRDPKEAKKIIIKYWDEFGEEAGSKGTYGHKQNELFLNGYDYLMEEPDTPSDESLLDPIVKKEYEKQYKEYRRQYTWRHSKVAQQFFNYIKYELDRDLLPCRTEQRLWSSKKIWKLSGSCDIFFIHIYKTFDRKGRLRIKFGDWKFTDGCKPFAWMCQLNIYQSIAECDDPEDPGGYGIVNDLGKCIIAFSEKQPDYRLFDIPTCQKYIIGMLNMTRTFIREIEQELDL